MKTIKNRMMTVGLLLVSIACSGLLWAETETLTGFISYVGKDHINLDNKIYSLQSSVGGIDMSKALMGNKTSAAFDVAVWWKGQKLTYETIQASGPIRKASVTLENGLVSEIRILETD